MRRDLIRHFPTGKWNVWQNRMGVWYAADPTGDAAHEFPTHAEAIAYADRMARLGK